MTARWRNHTAAAALIGALIAAAGFGLARAGLLERFELASWDWRVRQLAQPSSATDDIRLILIDQASLDWASEANELSWPWPRQAYEPILAFLQRAGARAVVLDLLFTETSSYGVADDRRLAEAAEATSGMVATLPLGQGGAQSLQGLGQDQLMEPALAPAPIPALRAERAGLPVAPLRATVDRFGNVIQHQDRDSVFRHIAPVRFVDERPVPALGLAAYLAAGEPPVDIADLALNADGRAILRFRGASAAYRPVSAAAVIQSELRLRGDGEPTLNPEDFRDKIVFLAASAPGLHDLGPTPLARASPRVMVHVTLLDNLMADGFMRAVPVAVEALYLLALGVGGALLVRPAARVPVALGLGGLVVAMPVVAALTAYAAGYWLTLVAPTGVAAASVAATLALNYAVEGRQRRFIRQAFQQYLSPAVIEHLVAEPDALRLGGETRELTLLFSDIQGFTGISEALTPEQLAALLNEYLSAMTEIIMAEGGTIDKYEGDAIIAFWNAPLDQPDHAQRGVRALLRCQTRLAALRPDLRERYGRELYARCGLNSGPVVVGNLGSRQRFDYTFLGDAGNLAARLEGVNKYFGTDALISGETQAQLPADWPVREIARVAVVGRAEPVTVLEPLTADKAHAHAACHAAFASALTHFYAGELQHALNGFATWAETDPPAAAYAEYCRSLIAAGEPGPEFDGVWHLSEK
jgi:adenylate cyclase